MHGTGAAEKVQERKHVLLTVGHGTMEQEAFVDLLQRAEIDLVVDVRSAPGSRRHPHFGRTALETWLPTAGIAYAWEPRLGGFRRPRGDSPNLALRHPAFRGYADHMATAEFHAALAGVVAEAKGRRSALMCSETLWWRCHRRLISDAATLLCGVEVRHLGHDGRLAPHRLTEGARRSGLDVVYEQVPTAPNGSAEAPEGTT